MIPRYIPASLFFVLLALQSPVFAQEAQQYDPVLYGGISAGVATAVQAKQMGKSVVIVSSGYAFGWAFA
ncbi:hypothetical protein Pan97_37480 [Bremerella volcania]|uniref:Uncharacterized protein n=1 Tax=Bremerella volcania TaxID=2527984 RepID=A0A518CBU3_9BACT|nr:hypothetical protein [Bremerella volcania]QDU76693.1 hypothetical protein Pan97_37480 [Bremerella volcania]